LGGGKRDIASSRLKYIGRGLEYIARGLRKIAKWHWRGVRVRATVVLDVRASGTARERS